MLLSQHSSPCSCLSCTLPDVRAGRVPHRSPPAWHPVAHLRSPAGGRALRVCPSIGCRVLLPHPQRRCGGRMSCWRWSKWYEELIRLFKSDNSKLTDENQE